MKYYSKKKIVKKVSKRPVGRKAYAKPSVSLVKKMIKREIARDVETKQFNQYDLGTNIYPINHASFVDSITPVAPSSEGVIIFQGTGQGDRIGNKIKIKKVVLKGTMHPLPYNATTNAAVVPVQVKFWFFYDRENPTSVPNPTSDFFQFGNTVSSMQNDLVDLWAPINKDKYTVLMTRTFKLGFAQFTTTGTVVSNSGTPNNDFKMNANFSFDLTKYMPTHYTYRDNNSNPTTRGLYWMAQAISATGTQFSATTVPAQMSWTHTVEYEDA